MCFVAFRVEGENDEVCGLVWMELNWVSVSGAWISGYWLDTDKIGANVNLNWFGNVETRLSLRLPTINHVAN